MLPHSEITLRRIETAVEEIRTQLYSGHRPLDELTVFRTKDRIAYAAAMNGPFVPAQIGERIGELWDTAWYHIKFKTPDIFNGKEIVFLWDGAGAEGCVWLRGEPVQGLNNEPYTMRVGGNITSPLKDGRTDFVLSKSAKAGEEFDFHVEAAANGLYGVKDYHMRDKDSREYFLRQAEVAVFDRGAWELYWDAAVLCQTMQNLPTDSPRRGQLLEGLNAFVNALVLEDRATWAGARKLLAPLYAGKNATSQHNLSAVGHAHIDTAWMWPLSETKRKCARTFSTALNYFDEYPDYKFACSQAQQYAWMKEHYPGLYARIKEAVKAGQFLPVGGTWIEPDCNLPSGESLVRQFLYGQRFFMREFGIRCTEFWNPDVFGYSAAVPQILAQCGIKYFLTQKLSWNQFNKPANHTFYWEGLDGSRVFTHFPPADTYNADFTPWQLIDNVKKFKNHDRASESLYLFGYGDGGGGPTKSMLEVAKRARDLDGLPRTEIRAPEEFWKRAEADCTDLPVWSGELYFELHRGTYTSQARNKLLNRRCEFLMREWEFLAAVQFAQDKTGAAYPHEAIEECWRVILLNQFHDIIPGSSITEVYRDSDRDYERVAQTARKAIAGYQPATPEKDKVRVTNFLGANRREVVETRSGELAIVEAPSCGYRVQTLDASVDTPVTLREEDAGFVLENHLLRARLGRDGRVASLIHKESGRETICSTGAGQLALYEDKPLFWDAWDLDVFHLEKRFALPGAVSARVIQRDALRVAVEFEYVFSRSKLRQVIRLDALSPWLEFVNHIDWREKSKILKAEFDVNVRAPEATYEIQFGHVKRPTHFNTSWDIARFEVCLHRWMDYAEHGFGVAMLNDSKYGGNVHGSRMALSLMRSSNDPDPLADRGEHEFRYALMPHAGAWQEAGVQQAALNFNAPLSVVPDTGANHAESFFRVSNPGIVIDTIKKAEDSDALIIRMYEAFGGRREFTLETSLPLTQAVLVNLIEEECGALQLRDGRVSLEVTPFKIVSVKLS